MEKKTRKKSKELQAMNKTTIILIILFLVSLIATMVILNSGKTKEINIPNFVGMTITEAEQKAKKIGVKLEIERNNGTIITSQEPRFMEGYEIKKGATIKVVIDE